MASYDISIDGNLECGEGMCPRKLCRAISSERTIRKHKVLQRGDRIELAGGSCRKIWIIIRGMTAICVGLADGRRQVLGLETPGHIICGMSANHQSGAWIEAFGETVLCELDLEGLTHFATTRHGVARGQKFVAELFSVIHQRLETCTAHLVTLGRLDSTERVTLFLLDMANRIGRPCNDGLFVELPMTREDIADYLGLNTETISRIFTRLRKSKLVNFTSRSAYSISDPGALERRLPLTLTAQDSAKQLSAFLSALQMDPALHDGARQ